jgi:hypothetical protein
MLSTFKKMAGSIASDKQIFTASGIKKIQEIVTQLQELQNQYKEDSLKAEREQLEDQGEGKDDRP